MSERIPPQLVMCRPDLTNLPTVVLPAGYTIGPMRGGDDEARWDAILGDSFNDPNANGMFARVMRPDPAFREDRVLFVWHGGEAVATSSAWFVPKHGELVGFIHYVGVLKAHAGKGLGRMVSLACLYKMREEGRTSAMLQTDDFRLPAIRQYLRLGFAPLLIHGNQRDRWRAVLAQLGGPGLVAQYAPALAGAIRSDF